LHILPVSLDRLPWIAIGLDPLASEKAPLPIVLHYGGLLIEQAITVTGSESHAVVLRRIMRGGYVGCGLELLFPGDKADYGNGDDAKAVNLAACAQYSIQERLLEAWATDPGISSQGD